MRSMKRRTQRRVEIERLLALRESEGLSLRELARRSGIPVGTLSWWAHKLRNEGPEHRFTEVAVLDGDHVIAADAEPAPAGLSGLPDLVVRSPGGVVLEARGEIAERIVDDMLEGLGRWC